MACEETILSNSSIEEKRNYAGQICYSSRASDWLNCHLHGSLRSFPSTHGKKKRGTLVCVFFLLQSLVWLFFLASFLNKNFHFNWNCTITNNQRFKVYAIILEGKSQEMLI